jgi:RimJ/RimL family protein N-acetyltransferase
MLLGSKVLLRPIKRSDIPLFLKWFNDPEVTQYLAMYLPMTEVGEEKWMQDLATTRANSTAHFVIETVFNDTTQPIGSIALNEINTKDRGANFGIAIGEKECWAQGLGTEAAGLLIKYGFEQLNLHRINSNVFSFNERSVRLHLKVGFIQEGLRREAVFKNGQYWDLIEFGLLVEEWKAGWKEKFERMILEKAETGNQIDSNIVNNTFKGIIAFKWYL